jgi:hypothetical protein
LSTPHFDFLLDMMPLESLSEHAFNEDEEQNEYLIK